MNDLTEDIEALVRAAFTEDHFALLGAAAVHTVRTVRMAEFVDADWRPVESGREALLVPRFALRLPGSQPPVLFDFGGRLGLDDAPRCVATSVFVPRQPVVLPRAEHAALRRCCGPRLLELEELVELRLAARWGAHAATGSQIPRPS